MARNRLFVPVDGSSRCVQGFSSLCNGSFTLTEADSEIDTDSTKFNCRWASVQTLGSVSYKKVIYFSVSGSDSFLGQYEYTTSIRSSISDISLED